MIRAAESNTTPSFLLADLDAQIDDEPRVYDIKLATQLGYNRPRKIREAITRNLPELLTYGGLPRRRANLGAQGGRPTEEYFLNEPQALLICMWSNTRQAAAVRKALIDVFMEYRRMKAESPIPVRAHERRTSTRVDDAIKLKKNIDRLETVVSSIQPTQPNFCAMVVDGRPVFVDVNAYSLDDEPAVVMTNDGQIKIMNASSSTSKFKPAGVRSGHGPWRPSGHGGRVQEGVVILGKVMKGAAQPAELPPPAAVPALPAPKPRGRPKMYRDEIVKLICDGLDNWAIVAKTGASYWTVAHWRRWMTSGPIAD